MLIVLKFRVRNNWTRKCWSRQPESQSFCWPRAYKARCAPAVSWGPSSFPPRSPPARRRKRPNRPERTRQRTPLDDDDHRAAGDTDARRRDDRARKARRQEGRLHRRRGHGQRSHHRPRRDVGDRVGRPRRSSGAAPRDEERTARGRAPRRRVGRARSTRTRTGRSRSARRRRPRREPVALAVSPDDATLYVATGLSHTLQAFRAGDDGLGERTLDVSVDREPRAVSISTDGKRAFVAHASSSKLEVVERRGRGRREDRANDGPRHPVVERLGGGQASFGDARMPMKPGPDVIFDALIPVAVRRVATDAPTLAFDDCFDCGSSGFDTFLPARFARQGYALAHVVIKTGKRRRRDVHRSAHRDDDRRPDDHLERLRRRRHRGRHRRAHRALHALDARRERPASESSSRRPATRATKRAVTSPAAPRPTGAETCMLHVSAATR